MRAWPITLCLLFCTGCGDLLMPRSFHRYGSTPKHSIALSASNEAFDADTGQIEHLNSVLDAYIDDVLPQLIATGLIIPDAGDYVQNIEVRVSLQLNPRGLYQSPYGIVIHLEDKMISVFGHELVRALLYVSDERAAAMNSSLDWSGDVGVLWNIAETTSLKYLEVK